MTLQAQKQYKYVETKNPSSSAHKRVLVIDNAQPTGIVANIADVLSVTFGRKVNNIVSHDVCDKQDEKHLGIAQLPIPILGVSQEETKEVRKLFNSLKTEELVLVNFSTIAQQSEAYDEHKREIYSTSETDLHYIDIGIRAEKKTVNRVIGCLSLIG